MGQSSSSARASKSGSSALSTSSPLSSTTLATTSLTSASPARSWTPYSPKWSELMFVMTATSRALRREPASQDAAARGFEDGGLDARVAQDRARTHGAGIVAALDLLALDEQAIRAVVAVAPAVRANTGGQQSHGGRLAVGACDDRRRHIAQLRPRHLARPPAAHRPATFGRRRPSPA